MDTEVLVDTAEDLAYEPGIPIKWLQNHKDSKAIVTCCTLIVCV